MLLDVKRSYKRLRGRWWAPTDFKEVKQQLRQRPRKRYLESALIQTLSRLFHLVI